MSSCPNTIAGARAANPKRVIVKNIVRGKKCCRVRNVGFDSNSVVE